MRMLFIYQNVVFFSSRRRHTRSKRDWSSDVCSSDLPSFINVHDIRDFLKGIKRNSRRKNDTNERQGNVVKTKVVQHADKGPGKEIKILENPKNREVQKQGKDEPLSAMWI